MELQLVYRILRKISDWTVTGYYSEVLIDGQGNALNTQEDILNGESSVNGPVILCSSHHNEMIDPATLAVTMPKSQGERRHVSFWAKESMFRNPVGGWIMRSSGAIPVKRNPNKSEGANSAQKTKAGKEENGSGNLFASTTHALSLNKVVGVFPEGTSYTQPGIVQVMPGAARAAVEYELWREKNRRTSDHSLPGKDVVIVPVGIVYTDKSRYMSRLVVRYGTPIRIKEYLEPQSLPPASVPTSLSSSAFSVLDTSVSSSFSHLEASEIASSSTFDTKDTARARAVTKAVTVQIEQALFGLTINAPDWETLYAAHVARDIIFEGRDLALREWVPVSQKLIDFFTPKSKSSDSLNQARNALTRYFAILHHTGLDHTVLSNVFPFPIYPTPSSSTFGSERITKLHRKDASRWTEADWKSYHIATSRVHVTHARSLAAAKGVAHVLAILPILPLYFPAFIVSHLTARFLATPGEEEGEAQFRGVGGGVGLSVGLLIGKVASRKIWTWTRSAGVVAKFLVRIRPLTEGVRESLGRSVGVLGERISDVLQMKFDGTGVIHGAGERLFRLSSTLRSREMNASAVRMLRGTGWLILAWCVVKWYGLHISHAHKMYTHTLALPARRLWTHQLRLLLRLSPRHHALPEHQRLLDDPELEPFLTLPPPPTNAFIRRKVQQEQMQDPANSTFAASLSEKPKSKPRQVPSSKLVPALLYAREEARQAVFSLDRLEEAVKES